MFREFFLVFRFLLQLRNKTKQNKTKKPVFRRENERRFQVQINILIIRKSNHTREEYSSLDEPKFAI